MDAQTLTIVTKHTDINLNEAEGHKLRTSAETLTKIIGGLDI
jgi:hypothetical protein